LIKRPKRISNLPKPNKDRNPYYGDLHVHTKYSFDAYVFGITASPDDATDTQREMEYFIH